MQFDREFILWNLKDVQPMFRKKLSVLFWWFSTKFIFYKLNFFFLIWPCNNLKGGGPGRRPLAYNLFCPQIISYQKISFGGSSLFLFVLRVNHQTVDFCTKIVHCMCTIGVLKNKPSKSYYFWVFVYIFSNHSNWR